MCRTANYANGREHTCEHVLLASAGTHHMHAPPLSTYHALALLV